MPRPIETEVDECINEVVDEISTRLEAHNFAMVPKCNGVNGLKKRFNIGSDKAKQAHDGIISDLIAEGYWPTTVHKQTVFWNSESDFLEYGHEVPKQAGDKYRKKHDCDDNKVASSACELADEVRTKLKSCSYAMLPPFSTIMERFDCGLHNARKIHQMARELLADDEGLDEGERDSQTCFFAQVKRQRLIDPKEGSSSSSGK